MIGESAWYAIAFFCEEVMGMVWSLEKYISATYSHTVLHVSHAAGELGEVKLGREG